MHTVGNIRRGMKSPPLDSTHGRHIGRVMMTSPPLECTHARQRRAWHHITALGQHTQKATSCVAFHHRPLTSHTVGRRRAWRDITTLGQHTWSNNVERGMPSSRLASTHDRTASGMACHHYHWESQTVKRRHAWHEITALGLHAQLEDVGRGITSPPLDSTEGRQRRAWNDITAFGHHTWLNDIRLGISSSPMGSTHGQTMLGVA